MAIYNDIIKTLGDNLEEYNIGAWALFRDQMAADISNQYVFGGGKKDDESLLNYYLPQIQRTNQVVKGVIGAGDKPKPKFTYFTKNGPVNHLNNGPILPDPMHDTLHIYNEFNVVTDDNDYLKQGFHEGVHYVGEYDEDRKINGKDKSDGLDRVTYSGGHKKEIENANTLVKKTVQWFEGTKKDYISKRFATQISRFHSKLEQTPIDELEKYIGLQAFSKEYGLSHGRNLLKENHDTENGNNNPNGYNDPYCRVWTWHKQYHTLKDTIRPFDIDLSYNSDGTNNSETQTLESTYNWSAFRSVGEGGFPGGGHRLQEYGVMYDNGGKTNGLVNITPSVDPDSTGGYNDPRNVSVEHCMFSIENLAWKGTFSNYDDVEEKYGLSREQKGPLGGRIMWFPPYDLKFDETTDANWQSNEFIGRGEPIYTYANTTRSGTLSFKLLIDHPAILDYWKKRNERWDVKDSGVDSIKSKEQTMLRFFAGCSVLEAGNHDTRVIPGNGSDDNNSTNNGARIEDHVKQEEKTIQFFVFYPNNYSGKDDAINGTVDPIEYLVNGAGTNKYWNQSSSIDLPTNPNVRITDGNGVQYGGYEIRDGKGISIVDSETTTNEITSVNMGGSSYTLMKMIGDKARKETTAPSDLAKRREWNKRRYYYRADTDTLNQVLWGTDDNGAVSYIDKTSHNLNSTGYTKAVKQFNIQNVDSTYSLLEMFLAFEDDINGIYQGLYDKDRVAIIKSIIKGERGRIKKVTCKGQASSQGNNSSAETNDKRNTTLAMERAKTVRKWLASKLGGDVEFGESTFTVDTVKKGSQVDSNDEYAKMNRFAFVQITYGGDDISNADDTQVSVDASGNTENNANVVRGNTDAPDVIDNETSDVTGSTVTESGTARYDGEALFFRKLTENEPFITKLLSERINNFDPVFHSMSPEGFNARLTFLNQCMRQGPTLSGSDANLQNMYNANNLSFGRPPVCVLRIGDFYNTKIIINSMTINYDPLVWDLNQEGIGVMPMIANINLSFRFIGGSDLGGPIQRLQNATSFNYYANAGVYDNRSENIRYDGPDKTQFKAFDPYIQK